jgi:hypothetical protein
MLGRLDPDEMNIRDLSGELQRLEFSKERFKKAISCYIATRERCLLLLATGGATEPNSG